MQPILGDTMKVGDLVRGGLGGIGIILREVGVSGAWMVHWFDDGKRYAVNAENLWLVKPCK